MIAYVQVTVKNEDGTILIHHCQEENVPLLPGDPMANVQRSVMRARELIDEGRERLDAGALAIGAVTGDET